MKNYVLAICLLLFIPCVCFSQGTVYSLAIDRGHSGDVYTSTYLGGFWKGDENLSSWQERNNGLSSRQPVHSFTILCAAMAPSNGNILYVGTTEGVYRSINGGQTWADTEFTDDSVTNLSFGRTTSSIYIGTIHNDIIKRDLYH